MSKKTYTPPTAPFSAEFRERAIQLFTDHRAEYASDNNAYRGIAEKLGCSGDSLRTWCLQAARDAGQRAGPTSEERARIKELERENRELRQANEILIEEDQERRQWRVSPTKGLGLFCPGGTRPPVPQMINFIEETRAAFGVEPICRTLPIAPSTYYAAKAAEQAPDKASPATRSSGTRPERP